MKEEHVRLFLDAEVLIRTRLTARPFKCTIIDINEGAVILKHNGTKSVLLISTIVSIQEVSPAPEEYRE